MGTRIHHGGAGSVNFGSDELNLLAFDALAEVSDAEVAAAYDLISTAMEGQTNGAALKATLEYLDSIAGHLMTTLAEMVDKGESPEESPLLGS